MNFLLDFIRQQLPDYDLNCPHSFACIYCSNLIYLVFNERSDTPALVIKTSDKKGFEQLFKNTQCLHKLLPQMITKPLAIGELNGTHFYIEEGLSGLPWFQIISSDFSTDKIRQLALLALCKFQNKVAENPHWQAAINLQNEVSMCWQQCQTLNINDIKSINNEISEVITRYQGEESINGQYQHGDYCINNLIFKEDAAAIIDLDEFGHIFMPLHDEFSLAVSMFTCQKNNKAAALIEEIQLCIKLQIQKNGYEAEQLRLLFLHFLLVKITENYPREIRKEYTEQLILILKEFIVSQPDFFNK